MTQERWCSATTRAGRKCPIQPYPGKTLCHVHDPDGKFRQQHPERRPRRRHGELLCSATTKKGRRCQKPAVPGGTLCVQHDPASRCRAITVKGRCGNARYPGWATCHFHGVHPDHVLGVAS